MTYSEWFHIVWMKLPFEFVLSVRKTSAMVNIDMHTIVVSHIWILTLEFEMFPWFTWLSPFAVWISFDYMQITMHKWVINLVPNFWTIKYHLWLTANRRMVILSPSTLFVSFFSFVVFHRVMEMWNRNIAYQSISHVIFEHFLCHYIWANEKQTKTISPFLSRGTTFVNMLLLQQTLKKLNVSFSLMRLLFLLYKYIILSERIFIVRVEHIVIILWAKNINSFD